jgi:hypothetical protein
MNRAEYKNKGTASESMSSPRAASTIEQVCEVHAPDPVSLPDLASSSSWADVCIRASVVHSQQRNAN